MLPPGCAAEWSKRIQRGPASRAGMFVLAPSGFQTLATLLLCGFLLGGATAAASVLALLVGILCNAALTAVAIVRVEKEIAGAVARAALVRTVYPRVVEFQVREWRIVGAER